MSFGLVELITLLLSLSGFSLQQNPKAATPEQALQYAMPDADIVVHVDATAIIGNNYKLLSALPDQPQIKASPELAKMVRKAVNEVEGLRGLAKTTTGIDLATDVSGATVFVQMPPSNPQGVPNLLVAVRGKFSAATIDRISKVLGPSTKVGGGVMIEPQQRMGPFGALGVTKDGTLLAGDSKLVKDRLADAWKAPARATGSNLAHVATIIEARPVGAIAFTLSQATRKQLAGDFKQKNFLTDILGRHKLLAFSVFTDGVGWTWIDSTKAGLDSMAQISEGMMEMMRAGQIAPRGFAKIAMGALDSYKGNKQVDELIRRKADLWKIVESYSGDGNFKVAIDKNPATLRLTARATGKTLSEVLPGGLLLPGAMWMLIGRSSVQEPPMTQPATPAQPAKPPRLSPSGKPVTPRPAPAPPPAPKTR